MVDSRPYHQCLWLILFLAVALALTVYALDKGVGQLYRRVAALEALEDDTYTITVEASPPVRTTAYEPQEDFGLWNGMDRRDRPLVPGRTIAAKDISEFEFPDGGTVMVQGMPNIWEIADTGDGNFELDVCMRSQEDCIKFGVRSLRAAAITRVRRYNSLEVKEGPLQQLSGSSDKDRRYLGGLLRRLVEASAR